MVSDLALIQEVGARDELSDRPHLQFFADIRGSVSDVQTVNYNYSVVAAKMCCFCVYFLLKNYHMQVRGYLFS